MLFHNGNVVSEPILLLGAGRDGLCSSVCYLWSKQQSLVNLPLCELCYEADYTLDNTVYKKAGTLES